MKLRVDTILLRLCLGHRLYAAIRITQDRLLQSALHGEPRAEKETVGCKASQENWRHACCKGVLRVEEHMESFLASRT